MPKSKGIYIRIDPSELEKWQRASKKLGLSLSAWIHGMCNDTIEIKPALQEVTLGELYGRLGRKACKHGLLFCKTCK